MKQSSGLSAEEIARAARDIAERVGRGEERALARLISGLEDGEPWSSSALRLLRCERRPPSLVIGVTGAPGSGKSTLVDKLIGVYRGRGLRVGVIAIDPSSPITGGAILGDRIRMLTQCQDGRPGDDEGLFIRSLASRGRLGGLSRASSQSARAMEAAGYGVVIVETVGIGQSEVDISRLADVVLLVSMPGSGDDIQTIKAGVMEIGDIFVVNKADRDGADRSVREIRAMLESSAAAASDELPPVVKTVAETGEGVPRLVDAIDGIWAGLKASGALEERRRRGAVAEARSLLSERLMHELESLQGGLEDRLAGEIVRGERGAAEAADILYRSILGKAEDV